MANLLIVEAELTVNGLLSFVLGRNRQVRSVGNTPLMLRSLMSYCRVDVAEPILLWI